MLARALVIAFAAHVAVQDRPAPRAAPSIELFDERALENDTFLPVAEAAEEALARGDALVAKLRASTSRDEAFPVGALDAWHDALAASSTGDAVRARLGDARDPSAWPPDPHADAGPASPRARTTIGVERAVRERLVLAGALDAWRARFAPVAEKDALGARTSDARAALERAHPFTPAAARAALASCDEAIERGDADAARAWLARSRAHLEGVATAEIDAAWSRRAAAIAPARVAAEDASEDASWRAATRLERATVAGAERVPVDLVETESVRREGTRVLAGGRVLADGSLLVQHAEHLVRVRAASDAPTVLAFAELLPAPRHLVARAFADRASDWPLVPDAASGDRARALCVVGRTGDEGENLVALVDLDLGALAWAREPSANGIARVTATESAPPEPDEVWASSGRIELQPGPRLAGDVALVHVRRTPRAAANAAARTDAEPARLDPGRLEAWLVALDPRDGRTRWARLLARGASPVAARERPNLGIRVSAPPAAPLAIDAGRVLVSTGLGTLACVDALDGRLAWSVRAARSREGEEWHPAVAAPRVRDGLALWSPEDGPDVLTLDLSAASVDALFARPPAPLAARALAGGDADAWVVVRSEGRGWEERAAGRVPARSFDPGRSERVLPCALVLERRVVAVTDAALYLLDRTRGLALLDRVPLAPGEAGRPVVDGDRVWLLGPARLACFRVR